MGLLSQVQGDAETLHVDGYHAEELEALPDGVIGIDIVQLAGGQVVDRCEVYRADNRDEHVLELSRLMPLLQACCEYRNANGGFKQMMTACEQLGNFPDLVLPPEVATLILVQEEPVDRRLYYRIAGGRMLVVIRDESVEEMSEEELDARLPEEEEDDY